MQWPLPDLFKEWLHSVSTKESISSWGNYLRLKCNLCCKKIRLINSISFTYLLVSFKSHSNNQSLFSWCFVKKKTLKWRRAQHLWLQRKQFGKVAPHDQFFQSKLCAISRNSGRKIFYRGWRWEGELTGKKQSLQMKTMPPSARWKLNVTVSVKTLFSGQLWRGLTKTKKKEPKKHRSCSWGLLAAAVAATTSAEQVATVHQQPRIHEHRRESVFTNSF